MLPFSRLAALSVVALVPTSVALVAPLSFSGTPEPISPKAGSVALVSGASVAASHRAVTPTDAAEAREHADGRAVEVKSASPAVDLPADLSVVGVTWERGSVDGASVQYRTMEWGEWGDWTFLEVAPEHAPDEPESTRRETRDGSDPLVVTRAEQLQVRVLGPVDDAAPRDPQLSLIDPVASAEDDTLANRPGAAFAVAKRPYIYSRADWGADETRREDDPSFGAVKMAVVHHTAATDAAANSYTMDQVPGIIRGIYAYHTGTYDAQGVLISGNGWGDIGYNFLVDRFGRTWEGRYGGTTRPVIGAHAYGANSYSFGVSVLGNFEVAAPPAAVTTALGRLVGWKAQVHEFNPLGKAKIGGVVYNGVSGHRNVNATECPGSHLYAALPTVRSGAAAQVKGVPSLTLDRDLDNGMDADVLATNAAGDLLLYGTTNVRGLTGPTTMETGTWTGRDEVHIVGDWNGDGAVDLVSRVKGVGALDLHRGTGAGGVEPPVKIGQGWSGFNALIAPGDWNGDGRNDLLGRVASDGTLWLYPGNGTGGFGRPSQIGRGWNGMRLVSGVGDWDGDGARDLLAVSKLGTARVYRGNGLGGFLGYIALPGDWSGREKVVGVGDASWDTKVDVLSVNAAGEAEFGLRGTTSTEITWSKVPTSLAGMEVYTG